MRMKRDRDTDDRRKGINRKWKSLRRQEDRTLSKVVISIDSGQGDSSW